LNKRRPTLFVDGYNLIKCVPLFAETVGKSLQAARDHLETVLATYARRSGTKMVIYYDGDGDVSFPNEQQRGEMDIFFSRRPQKADDMIMDAIARKHGARWLRIVTSDREIQRFAARHNVAFISSTAFADEMEEPLRTASDTRDTNALAAEFDPHWAPDSSEVEELARAFEQTPQPQQRPRANNTAPGLELNAAELDEWEELFTRPQKNQKN